MNPRRVRRLAALASFLVYFIPLIGPHALFSVGGMVITDLGLFGEDKELAWVAVDIAFALAQQALAFGLFAWVLSGRLWRWLTLLPAALAGVWVSNIAYMIVVPTWFLLEADTAPERATWELACTVEDASLLQLRSGADLALTRAGEAWIQREPEGVLSLLRMPGCAIADSRHRRSGTDTVDYAVPGGRVLHRIRDKASNLETHWFDAGAGAAPVALTKPSEKWWNPTLSTDASAIAWIESERGGKGRRPVYRVVTRTLAGGEERRFDVPLELFSGLRILAFDAPGPAREGGVLLYGGGKLIAELNLEGEAVWGPLATGDVSAGFDTVLRLGDGWVVWEGYRERGRYRVQWSLAGGSGLHEVLKGRSIQDVAVDASGRFLAISVSNSLNLGDVPDSVYVLRVADGAEVQRRYLARYNRTPVVFLGSEFLVLHRHRTEAGRVRGTVEVLRLPAD
jgi:hypothetical protein